MNAENRQPHQKHLEAQSFKRNNYLSISINLGRKVFPYELTWIDNKSM